MKRVVGVVVSVFALLLVVGAAQGADINTAKGSTSLMFNWSGLSNLAIGGYQHAYGVGIRHFLQDGLAVRPGVRLNVASSKIEAQTEGVTDDESSEFEIGLSAVVESHRDVGIPSVSPWLGAGAGFVLTSMTDEPSRPVGQETKIESSTFGFEAFLAAGFAWGIVDGMTLGGEYQAGVQLASGKVEVDGETTGEISGVRFGFQAVAVFLSVAIF
jgi:hypothetical protein